MTAFLFSGKLFGERSYLKNVDVLSFCHFDPPVGGEKSILSSIIDTSFR